VIGMDMLHVVAFQLPGAKAYDKGRSSRRSHSS